MYTKLSSNFQPNFSYATDKLQANGFVFHARLDRENREDLQAIRDLNNSSTLEVVEHDSGEKVDVWIKR